MSIASYTKSKSAEVFKVFCYVFMIETNRIEFKRELTKDLDIEKEDIFGDSLGSGIASVMKSYSPANFTFFPHFVRFSVEYINHAILSRESKTSESGLLNAESGRINVESGRINGENGRINADTANLTKNEAKILHIISKEEGLSVINLQLKTELAERTIFRHIASLTQKHLIERRGSKKTGGYWLVDSTHKENS